MGNAEQIISCLAGNSALRTLEHLTQTIWQQRHKSLFISRKKMALIYFIVYSFFVAYALWEVLHVTALQVVNRRNANITSNIKLYVFSKSGTLEVRTNYLEVDMHRLNYCLSTERKKIQQCLEWSFSILNVFFCCCFLWAEALHGVTVGSHKLSLSKIQRRTDEDKDFTEE